MTLIDWLIIGFAAVLAAVGYQAGLIVGALTLAGFVGGAFLGSRLGPALLEGGSSSPYAALTALVGGLITGAIAAIVVEGIARSVHRAAVRGRGTALVDRLGGAAVFAALGLGLAWVAGAAALNTPGLSGLRADIQRSTILAGLNDLLPPSGGLLNVLNRIDPTPRLSGPQAEVAAPEPAVANDPDVARATESVVRVLGTACGLGLEGSGWVAAPGVVVTNAHVVAGQDDTEVALRGETTGRPATPVHYEPRNDLAVLSVDGLEAPPLAFAGSPAEGEPGAVIGFPGNGPLRVTPARLGATNRVTSQDSYGRGPLQRSMTVLRARVRSGNSGGPVVDTAGRVMATVFAASLDSRPPEGFGVPNRVVRRALGRSGSGPVDTGPCAT